MGVEGPLFGAKPPGSISGPKMQVMIWTLWQMILLDF